MTDEQRQKCGTIIHGASLAAAGAGAGLAQMPAADAAVLFPIQVAMIISLGRVFGVQITEANAKALAVTATSALAGRAVSQILLGWLPVVGNALNALTAASITEIVGWIIARRFATGQFDTAITVHFARAEDADNKRIARRLAVRVAMDADTPDQEAAVLQAVRNVVTAIGFVNDDEAA